MQDQRQQRKGARVPSFSRRHEQEGKQDKLHNIREDKGKRDRPKEAKATATAVSYTHLRAHETRHDLVCRLLL